MKSSIAATPGWGKTPLTLLAVACASTFAASSAAATPSCSITLHNKSGVELVLKMKILDADEKVVIDQEVTIAKDSVVPLSMNPTDATLSFDVYDNGKSIGVANYFGRQVSACELPNHSNQPACNNSPGPGDITLIRNNRNCP